MEEYKRWKFWERWGWIQLVVAVIMFMIPMFIIPEFHSTLHYILVGSMTLGIILAISALFISLEFGGRVARYELRQKFDRCPTCKQGWIRKEK